MPVNFYPALRSSAAGKAAEKRKHKPTPRTTPKKPSNPRGAPEGHYPPVEQLTYPKGDYAVASLRVIRKTGEEHTENYPLLGQSYARQPLQQYASLRNFDKYWWIEIQWRLTDPDSGVTFLYNKTTREPLRNVLCPEDIKRGAGTFTWADLEPLTKRDRLGSWMVVGGDGSDRRLPTLSEQLQLAHSTPGAGAKQQHTGPFYCAQNAFSNLLGLSREDDDQLRAQADPKMHIKAYGGMLDKHSSYFRLVQVDKDARKATRSPPDKLKWLLDTTA